MGTWANAQRYPTLYTWPSIVDHRKGPSLRNARFTRVAINYAPDARELDFGGTILGLPFDSRVPTPRENWPSSGNHVGCLHQTKPSR